MRIGFKLLKVVFLQLRKKVVLKLFCLQLLTHTTGFVSETHISLGVIFIFMNIFILSK